MKDLTSCASRYVRMYISAVYCADGFGASMREIVQPQGPHCICAGGGEGGLPRPIRLSGQGPRLAIHGAKIP